MKKYLSFFVHNEEGVEIIEFIGIIAIAAVLLVIAANVGQQMIDTGRQAENTATQELDEIEKALSK